MKDSTLIAVFTYGGMLLVAAGFYAVHWGAACVWLGCCFFLLAAATNSASDKKEKANNDDALDRKIRSRDKYAREQDVESALKVAKSKEKNP